MIQKLYVTALVGLQPKPDPHNLSALQTQVHVLLKMHLDALRCTAVPRIS